MEPRPMRELYPGVVVAELSVSSAMIESAAQLDSEIPRVKREWDLGCERMWDAQQRVHLSQYGHETGDLFAKQRVIGPKRVRTRVGTDVLSIEHREEHTGEPPVGLVGG